MDQLFFLISLLEPVIISLTQGLVVMSSELEDVFGSMMVGRVRLRLFSPFTGYLLRRIENHSGLGFCSHIRTKISARFL